MYILSYEMGILNLLLPYVVTCDCATRILEFQRRLALAVLKSHSMLHTATNFLIFQNILVQSIAVSIRTWARNAHGSHDSDPSI